MFFKDALVFGIPLLPHALSFWLRSGIDRIYISNFWGSEQVGLYATGFQFGLLVSFLISAFNNAFSPYLFKTLSGTDEIQLNFNKRKIVRLTYYIIFGLSIAGLIFAFLSKYIIKFWFSKEYIQSIDFVTWAI
ncbi:lipopolysaccharide biosynthesis protein [Sphingobacterium daejeonense]|uniref:lipopolysaccharide biosynthesis protein n=1 Tax=Sphingobacterium daejeonense TaxID=371142 RepID=UPI0010FD72DA